MANPKISLAQKGIMVGNTMVSLGCLLTIIIPICVIGICLVISLFSKSPTTKTTDDYMQKYGGDSNVYDRILSLSDCTAIENEFNIAFENSQNQQPGTQQYEWSVGYMSAANDRMKASGCYATPNSFQIPSQVPTNVIMQIVVTESSATAYILPTLTQPATVASASSAEPSATFIFKVPTAPASSGASGVCSCSGDNLNCIDFSTQSDAQSCFNFCVQQGVGDINHLDSDKDNIACEANDQ